MDLYLFLLDLLLILFILLLFLRGLLLLHDFLLLTGGRLANDFLQLFLLRSEFLQPLFHYYQIFGQAGLIVIVAIITILLLFFLVSFIISTSIDKLLRLWYIIWCKDNLLFWDVIIIVVMEVTCYMMLWVDNWWWECPLMMMVFGWQALWGLK